MAFIPAKETYTGRVYPVTIGTGESAVTFGGENVLTFHSFEFRTCPDLILSRRKLLLFPG